MMERIKANDPFAMSQVGTRLYHEGDYDIAIKYWTKAAELGDMGAHFQLGYVYMKEGVKKDQKKAVAVYHYEMAAIGGHPTARYNLGCYEERKGNIERSVKHHIIAAKLGDEDSMKKLWKHYSGENITKEDLETTLRTHKAAIDAMKSPEREAAEAWRERQRVARRT
jgi:TPR repeat protein